MGSVNRILGGVDFKGPLAPFHDGDVLKDDGGDVNPVEDGDKGALASYCDVDVQREGDLHTPTHTYTHLH